MATAAVLVEANPLKLKQGMMYLYIYLNKEKNKIFNRASTILSVQSKILDTSFMAATALLIEASPLKLKQSTLLHTFRPLPSKPIKLSTATFSYQRCVAPRFKNPKPQRSLPAEKTHFTAGSKSDHPSLFQCLNVFKDNRPAAANPNFTAAVNKLWEKPPKALRKLAMAAVLLGLLVVYNPNSAAVAAPVGRVGGSLTSKSTKTSYHPSENSSTKIKTSTDGYYEPIWDWGLILVFFPYFFGGIFLCRLPLPTFFRAELFILWTAAMANWFRSLGQTSVVKLQLQVNLSNTGRAVQMDLNQIAETADLYTHEGLRHVLRDTAVALLRQPDYCISGYSSVVIPKFTRAAAQQCFDKLLVRERVRYDEEKIVSVDNIKTQGTASQTSTYESHNDDVVVTILLAAEGKSESLTVIDSSDVKRVLEELASIDPSKRVLGVEVLWTPQLSSNAASKCIN